MICTSCKKSFEPRGERAKKCLFCTREYNRAWYQKNKANRRKQLDGYAQASTERNRNYVCQHLSSHPCLDCGESDPIVLEFDHVSGDKIRPIAKMIHDGTSLERLQAEIEKCEVRCANCHRRATSKRAGWFKWRDMQIG